MKIIPLATRSVSDFPDEKSKDESFGLVSALLKESDVKNLRNVMYSLYESGFDIYLSGELVEKAIEKVYDKIYSAIELIAATSLEENRAREVNVLKGHKERDPGSDQWVHFGIVVSHQSGFSIIDRQLGTRFWCDYHPDSQFVDKFTLEAAIYDSSIGRPSPIYLYFPVALSNFQITMPSGKVI